MFRRSAARARLHCLGMVPMISMLKSANYARSDGQQVGDVIEVNRGIQTAVIRGIEAGKDYSLFIRSVDRSGNVSQESPSRLPILPPSL